MTRVTQLIHDAGKYLLISVYPLPTHPTHNFTHNNGGNLETLPGWPKKLQHNRPARSAGQKRQHVYNRDQSTLYNVHYSDVIMSTMASQITSVSIVHSTVCSGADQRKYQGSTSLALCEGNSPVTGEFPTQRTVTRKFFPFGDAIMKHQHWVAPDPYPYGDNCMGTHTYWSVPCYSLRPSDIYASVI